MAQRIKLLTTKPHYLSLMLWKPHGLAKGPGRVFLCQGKLLRGMEETENFEGFRAVS